MRANDLVDKLIESDADDVDPKHYLRKVESPMREVAIRAYINAMVHDNPIDSRALVAKGLETLGVDHLKATLIALDQGSSQAYVNRRYLSSLGLTGRMLKDALEFIRVVYDVEQNEDLLNFLYDKFQDER